MRFSREWFAALVEAGAVRFKPISVTAPAATIGARILSFKGCRSHRCLVSLHGADAAGDSGDLRRAARRRGDA
jgi:hypothetical protein